MRLGLGIGIDKTNIAAISGGLRAKFLGTGTQYTQLGPITRQLTAAMTGDGTQSTDLLVTKRFAPNYTGDGTLTATLDSYDYLLSGDGDAAAAYSIRSLNPDYTGALVLIRRSSDNAEKAFYPDANFELSLTSEDGAATTLSSWIGSDNGFIKTWYDQSGNSNNATITTTSQQHQIVNAGALITSNLKPAGNGENKQGYAMSTPVTAQTSLSVVRKNVSEPYNYAFGSVSPSITGLYIGRSSTNLIGVFSTLATNSDSSVVTGLNTQYLIYANKASGTTFDVSKNGDADDSITDSGTLYCNYIFGRNLDFLTLSGLGQEIIIFSTDKSSSKATLINNINTYYSIY